MIKERTMTLEEKLTMLPSAPGVYLMKDERGRVIYVGKAVSLKNRVRSYFNSQAGLQEKTRALVSHIRDLEWILTDSEMEALILECNLIKKHQPRYNIRLVDDKHYPYLRITLKEDFPRIEMVRSMKKDGGRYFGPYTSSKSVHETLKLLKVIFPIRSCVQKEFKNKRPCLNAHIGRCLAPCAGGVSIEAYRKMINDVVLFLEGRQDTLKRTLEERMEKASAEMAFESAARFRDQLAAVEQVIQRQKIISDRVADFDVVNYVRGLRRVCVQVFFVRSGKLTGREHFMLESALIAPPPKEAAAGAAGGAAPETGPGAAEGAAPGPGEAPPEEDAARGEAEPAAAREEPAPEEEPAAGGAHAHAGGAGVLAAAGEDEAAVPEEDVLMAFLKQYYSRVQEIPPEICVPYRGMEADMTEAWLSSLTGRKVRLKVPRRGDKRGLLEMVVMNARETLQQEEAAREQVRNRREDALTELARALGLEQQPFRMECYDISNIQGTHSVASMVVFENGRPAKDQYRRFRIKTVEGPDDFASMAEVILRRFDPERIQDEKFGVLPDLVVVDGGKGQLSSARAVMALRQMEHIATVGLAKENEWIFLPNTQDPVVLSKHSPGLQMLQQIRDEAHRFAITYHRLLRGRSGLASALDEISGLGPKGKQALLAGFDLSLKNIQAATLEDLEQTPGIQKKAARAVYDYFHPAE
ncbi:MAG: excinuclease ABC subunit UvrC [Peptococcaceae bacterium]|jgi:excinuclease ABC subunit C|nr:excinuclease ABC subunit UvrC [Peptococcaceae bacterium]